MANRRLIISNFAVHLFYIAAGPIVHCDGGAAGGSIVPPGLNVVVRPTTENPANFLLRVDGVTWFRGGTPPAVDGKPLKHEATLAVDGNDEWGPFWGTEWEWSSGDDDAAAEHAAGADDSGVEIVLTTQVRVYRDRELVIFTQSWPRGYQSEGQPVSGGHDDPLIASFPSFDAASGGGSGEKQDLAYLGWGDCFAGDTASGPWHEDALPSFDGATSGVPLVWHDSAGRTVVMSPMGNYFVSGQALDGASSSPWLECGIRSTVLSLPVGFSHSTVLVGGQVINNTMTAWGDHLLAIGGKKRTDPYEDFVLSHLGYWTDNGAYYYHLKTIPGFSNEEEALKAVKADLLSRNIPVRYFQWDDWWMESEGDIPGITSWTPLPSVFPSGFTDWLGEPLSLYAPMYASDSTWRAAYDWKVDEKKGQSAIPLDPRFYLDLFANGTAIGMQMFEQDFLCSMNTDTSLTNSDVHSGSLWVAQMDAAAAAEGVSLQWCMMNACHALQSTLVQRVTNGRATGDNTREDPNNIDSMGQNGLLFYALGLFASRDNVWTTPPDTEQPDCEWYPCVEKNALADNAVALLGGGPYGPSDAFGLTQFDVVSRAVRRDGVLLRPKWPLSSLDSTFLSRDSRDRLPLVWAAHDDFPGAGRWSYIVGINLDEPFSLTPGDLLQQPASFHEDNMAAVAWPVELNTGKSAGLKVTRINSSQPLQIPATPAGQQGPGSSLWAVAPMLSNGMALLGDASKWATMSTRRFENVQMKVARDSLRAQGVILSATVRGAPGEKAVIHYVLPHRGVSETTACVFSNRSGCDPQDKHGDIDCYMLLECTITGCNCTDQMDTSEETSLW